MATATRTTTFRAYVATLLSTALSIKFVPGYLDPPTGGYTDRDLGCTFPLRIEPLTGLLTDYTFVGVRVFLRNPGYQEAVLPHDPTALEFAADTLQTTLGAHETSGGPWIMLLSHLDFLNDRYGLDCEIRGEQASPAL